MKQLIIILFSLGIISTASAQWRDHGFRERGRISVGINIGTSPRGYYDHGYYNNGFETRAQEINREYDHRIWEVSNSYDLNRWEKRRMIRQLNDERESRLIDLRRWRERDYDRPY